jgi:hypothetical protein
MAPMYLWRCSHPPAQQSGTMLFEFTMFGMVATFYEEAAPIPPNAVESGTRTIPVPVVET